MTITAKIIADSINPNGVRITTMEIEYPRFIHAEVMTHRMFSRNSASSRAIPASKVIEQVKNNPAAPVHWGKNQPGMQAKEELQGQEKTIAQYYWREAADQAAKLADNFAKLGVHKQIVNRILEPFQTMKVVVTATEWNNFWYLRDHEDAQPEIQKLARVMKGVYDCSKPAQLQYGMWHLPYIDCEVIEVNPIVGDGASYQLYKKPEGGFYTLEQAIKISCSSAAQVSYRRLDTSLEKAEDIFKKLVESEPVHASAFEHVALCANALDCSVTGWTHHDIDSNLWSGNFRDWIQYRQLIPNNVKRG